MLRHIEDNECRSHWTIKHLNMLAEECNGAAQFIIPGRRRWFRAGAPPRKPSEADYNRSGDYFTCCICDEDYEMESQLKRHYKERECSYDYPSVLQCPSCPEYGFERLCELFEHLERQRCQTACAKWWRTDLARRIERKFEDPWVQRRLDNDGYKLQADWRRPGRLRAVNNDEVRWRRDRRRY